MKKLAISVLSLGSVLVHPAYAALANTSSQYWNDAQQTHNFTVGNLLTSSSSYLTEVGSTTTTEWYDASQILADATMIQFGDSRYLSYMDNTYSFMNHLWDSNSSIGGYFAQANSDGTNAGGDQYVDDNSLTGNAYLNAYQVTTGTDQSNYLNSAEAIANWLMNCGLWDNTDGGGFWWTTNTSSSDKIKGTEVNGLACELFLRLYQITGASYYKQWADSIYNWLNTSLYDSSSGLYDWEYEQSTNSVNPVKFTYDNAIMIEDDLLYRQITGNSNYLSSAESIASNMINTLWNTQNSNGAFIINTSDPRFNPCYSGWASEAFIELYQADGNTTWLNYAQQNIDTINSTLLSSSNGGYYNGWVPSTGSLDDTSYQTYNQAWMQRVQAMLSEYK